jgi:selenium metabolism protein YedF
MNTRSIVIQAETLGKGDDRLGSLLMANFLRLLGECEDKPVRIIFWNGGVRLLCQGSEVLEHVKRIEKAGVEILACTTCLEYFNLMDQLAIGKPTTMVKSIETMLTNDVITL